MRVLIIEDSEIDARLLLILLQRGGYEPHHARVETAGQLRQALAEQSWDMILADYSLPQFSGLDALRVVRESGLDLPFLVVSGAIGEETAVETMRAGAHDYLMKNNLVRLVPAVERELREAANRAAKRQANLALRQSELRYRALWETATDAIVLLEAGGQILFANPAVAKIFGYEQSELVGQPFGILQAPSVGNWFQDRFNRFLASGKEQLDWAVTETVARRKDNAEIPVEVVFNYLELDGKKTFVGFFRDISERKLAQRELRQNHEQFLIARDIQQHLFPKTAPEVAGFDLAGASQPAEATGGDYFDYLHLLQNRLGLVVGDVTGHGLGPAMIMSETRAYLRLLAKNRNDPGQILTRANSALAEDIGADRFVTLLLVSLDPAARRFTFANAGHPPGYLLDRTGRIKRELRPTGIALGLQLHSIYQTSITQPLEPGDMIVLLTDGFEESVSPDDDSFGIDRTLAVLRQHQCEPAAKIVAALYKAVAEFSKDQPQTDDLTLLIAKAEK